MSVLTSLPVSVLSTVVLCCISFSVMAAMETRLEGMSIGEDGGFVIDVEEDKDNEGDPELCLVGRFIADRAIRTHIMIDRMAKVWRPVKKVQIKEVKPGLFLFQFFHKADMNQVLVGGPWFFDNYTLVQSLVKAEEVPTQTPLFHVPMWVQVHDVLIGFMSQTVGKHLGNFIMSSWSMILKTMLVFGGST